MVLPFTNLTGDPSHDYFIDGFTEELIAQLGHRCADRVGVLARTSAMLYKDVRRGAADIGEALRVDYLVEGSVRVGGNRVRITAQLIETRGETHLWAHSYDREYSNCLAVQSEVAAEIAVALERELFPPRRGGSADARPRRARGLPDGPVPLEPPGSGRPADRHRLLRSGARHRSRLRPRPFVAGPRLPVAVGVLRRWTAGDALRIGPRRGRTAPWPSTRTTATRWW